MYFFHFGDALDQLVAHGGQLFLTGGDIGAGHFHGFAQTDDGSDVLGAGAAASFLGAAVDQIGQAQTLAAVENADALLGMDLVSGQREHIDVLLFHVDLHIADGLDRIGVEQNAVLFADGADLRNGLNGADLVVGVHDGHQSGVLTDGILYLLGGNETVLVHRQVGDLKALFFQSGTGVQNGVMLEYGGDDVLFALGRHQLGGAFDGPVVRLGAAGGEVDLHAVVGTGLFYAQRFFDLVAGIFHGETCLTSFFVDARSVAVAFAEEGEHSVQYFFRDRRGRSVVGIYELLFHI